MHSDFLCCSIILIVILFELKINKLDIYPYAIVLAAINQKQICKLNQKMLCQT